MDEFSKLHPVINFTYFLAMIVFTMFFMHPVFLAISLVASMTYLIYLQGVKAIKNSIIMSTYVVIMVTVINMLISNQGSTILFFIGSKSITLESIYYSIASSIMFISIFMWFSCYNSVMTADKFLYLFGRYLPSISLIISMVFRLIPNFKLQAKKIKDAQKAMGRDLNEGCIKIKIKNGMKLLSILMTWALENSIETVDSMKARGYGLSKRSNFYIHKFENRDKFYLIVLLCFIGVIISGVINGENSITYFPNIVIKDRTVHSYIVYISYAILGLLPELINIQDYFSWKKSKINI